MLGRRGDIMTYGFRLSVLGLIWGLGAATATAQEESPLVSLALTQCEAQTFQIVDDTVCLRATITMAMAEAIEAHPEPISSIVLDTLGGDMAASLRIGRRVFSDKAHVIVDGECSSSCANYLAPLGHRKLHVTEGSFIAMHGTPPRDLFGFIDARRRAAGKTVEELVADPNTFFGFQREFPDHVQSVVIPEVQYFADVSGDEAYATRFAEVMRTLEMRAGYNCTPNGPALLIVGPQWMARFRVNSRNVWWVNDRRALIDRLPASLRDFTLIIDGDEHPSWIPGRGFVTPADCTASSFVGANDENEAS